MKIIIFILSLSFSAWAIPAIVQQTTSATGTASGSGIFFATTGNTNFALPTTAGNLIVAVTWTRGYLTSGTLSSVHAFSLNGSPSFTFGQSGGWTNAGSTANGETAIYFCANCASIPNTSTFTFTGDMSGGSGSRTVNLEFFMVEISGIVTTSPKDASSGGSGAGTTPLTGMNFVATQADLGIAMSSGEPGANVSVGSCCSLGTNASFATIGQVQYVFNLSTGSTSATFSAGTLPTWGGAVITFKASSSTLGSVPRHRGFVN